MSLANSTIQTVGLHLIGILFFATAYLGWAAFGRLVTDYSPFFWLDKKEVGSDEAITLYSIGFVFLIPISKLAPSSEHLPKANKIDSVYLHARLCCLS
jgi:hypothetical protein